MELGIKVKWRCPECGFRIVTIENEIESPSLSEAA